MEAASDSPIRHSSQPIAFTWQAAGDQTAGDSKSPHCHGQEGVGADVAPAHPSGVQPDQHQRRD
jgi:hypothetical protein